MAVSWICLSLIHYLLALRTIVFNWVFSLRRIAATACQKQTLCRLRADSKTIQRLPIHIGIVIVENEISYTDIANILIWSMAMGVSYISLYDHVGLLKRGETSLRAAIEKQQTNILGKEKCQYQVHLHNSSIKKRLEGGCRDSFRTDVTLLSVEDGRRRIVETAKTLSQAVDNSRLKCEDIIPASVDAILLDGSGFPDPDLLLRFGQVDSIMGFLPWQIRLTEMLGTTSHHNMDYATFHQLLTTFGGTQQRLGK